MKPYQLSRHVDTRTARLEAQRLANRLGKPVRLMNGTTALRINPQRLPKVGEVWHGLRGDRCKILKVVGGRVTVLQLDTGHRVTSDLPDFLATYRPPKAGLVANRKRRNPARSASARAARKTRRRFFGSARQERAYQRVRQTRGTPAERSALARLRTLAESTARRITRAAWRKNPDDTWRYVQAIIDKVPVGTVLKSPAIQAKATAHLDAWLRSHLRHHLTVSSDEVRQAWMTSLFKAAKEVGPRSNRRRRLGGGRGRTKGVRRSGRTTRAGSSMRPLAAKRLRRNPRYHRMAAAVDVAGVFTWPLWHHLSLEEAQEVLMDIAELADDEMDGDDIAAARALRQRIGGPSALKSYAKTLVAGSRRRGNPKRRKATRKGRNPIPRSIDKRSVRTVRSGRTRVTVGCPKGKYRPRARGRKKCSAPMRFIEQVRGKARRNPRESEVARARRTFRKWHEFDPHHKPTMVKAPRRVPRVMVKLGDLHSVVYRSDKWDGKPKLYEHKTRRPRPVLATDPDGRDVFIVGGRMKPTADGLVN